MKQTEEGIMRFWGLLEQVEKEGADWAKSVTR